MNQLKMFSILIMLGLVATLNVSGSGGSKSEVIAMTSIPSFSPETIAETKEIRSKRSAHKVAATKAEQARIAEAERIAAEKHAAAHALEAKRAAQAKADRGRKQASRSRQPAPEVKAHSAPGGIAACIRKYESGNNYRAENPSSSASGAYQFIDGTWRSITGRSDRAKDAPPAVQDAAFWKLWDNGRGARHWVVAPKCGF